jgi:large subunit ribosomal protein L21
MYAIIETGGKQYRVAPGDEIRVEKLPGEVNEAVAFDRVLAVATDTGEVLAGSAAAAARVTGTITGEGRARKVTVFKFKRKRQYKRTIGHRQRYTQVRISDITV